jgi:hypothetical protein
MKISLRSFKGAPDPSYALHVPAKRTPKTPSNTAVSLKLATTKATGRASSRASLCELCSRARDWVVLRWQKLRLS